MNGIEIRGSDFLPFTRMVEARSGDARNPFPRFALRPRKVAERIDAIMLGGKLVASHRSIVLLKGLAAPTDGGGANGD